MGRHSDAVEQALSAADLGDVDAPLAELARVLAWQMDAAGLDGPGTRLVGSYLTAVRTLTARIVARRAQIAPVPSDAPKEEPGADVIKFRNRARGRRQAG